MIDWNNNGEIDDFDVAMTLSMLDMEEQARREAEASDDIDISTLADGYIGPGPFANPAPSTNSAPSTNLASSTNSATAEDNSASDSGKKTDEGPSIAYGKIIAIILFGWFFFRFFVNL